jgi:hypothetical protein
MVVVKERKGNGHSFEVCEIQHGHMIASDFELT